MILAATSSAPPNIFLERCLGMADFLIWHSLNVSVGFLDSKLKAVTNHTMDWLDKKPTQEQVNLVTFAMQRGALIRKTCILLQHEIDQDIMSRMKQLKKKFEATERRETEKSIYVVLSGSNVSVKHPLFCCVDRKQKPFLSRILGVEDLVGVQLTHKWELDDQKVHRYYGMIINRVSAKKNKSAIYTVSYLAQDKRS